MLKDPTPNGNTKISNGKTYNYDFENHLTSTSDGVTIVYDGDGNRVSKTAAGVTTNYLVDTNNLTGYAQVVEELQGGSVVKSYTYGHDLISQRDVGGNVSFYGYDGHGSVRNLTDSNAQITDTYTYDAFGNLIESTGATSNNYLYAGEQFDADLGFYYNRARYLNVATGRFVTMDSYQGSPSDPLSLHKYTYALPNPVLQIDPSGFMATSVAELTIVETEMAQLTALVTLVFMAVLEGIKTKIREIERQRPYYIYRQGENKPRSVALRREIDWQTGLSFSLIQPAGPSMKYSVITLIAAGYVVRVDGGLPVTMLHTGEVMEGGHYLGPDHVTIYLADLGRWDAWYEAESQLRGIPLAVSPETTLLWSLQDPT